MAQKRVVDMDVKPTYGMLAAQVELLQKQNGELFAENHKMKHLREVLVGLTKLADKFVDSTKEMHEKVDELGERMDGIMEALRKRRRDR